VVRRGIGVARPPDAPGIETILESGGSAVDEKPVEVREDAAEICRDLGDGSRLEAKDRDAHIVEAEAGSFRRDAIAEAGDLDDALAGEPEQQIDDMNAATQHHRVIILLAAPAIEDLVDSAVIIVRFEMEEPAKLAALDLCLERAKARRAAQ